MLVYIRLFCSLCFFTFVQTSHAAFASGQDLLDGFNAQSRIGMSNSKPTDPPMAARITGYIQGTIDSGISAGILCPSGKNLTVRTAQPVIVEYLQKNPQMHSQPAVETVLLSLHPKYKCK